MTVSSANWASLSNNLIYGAIAVFALALLAYAAETAGRVAHSNVAARATTTAPGGETASARVSDQDNRPWVRLGAVGTALFVTGFGLNVSGILARGLAAQRAPWGNMFEFAVTCAVTVSGAYLLLPIRRQVRELGVWVVALVLLLLGLAVTVLYTPVDALVPVLDSYWLVVHVAAAILSGGVFAVGAVATVLFLVRSRADARIRSGATSRRSYSAVLPEATTLEQVAHTAHIFVFPIWTFAVMAGAIWAENAWGRYWGWDPKETWAFITWVLYAAYLHAQSTPSWRGRKASWLALAGFLAFAFNFFGVNMWISGLHSYAGV